MMFDERHLLVFTDCSSPFYDEWGDLPMTYASEQLAGALAEVLQREIEVLAEGEATTQDVNRITGL